MLYSKQKVRLQECHAKPLYLEPAELFQKFCPISLGSLAFELRKTLSRMPAHQIFEEYLQQSFFGQLVPQKSLDEQRQVT